MEYFSYTTIHGFCVHSTLREAEMRVEAVLRLERDHAVSKDWPNDICVNCCGKIIYKIAQVLDGQSDYASLFDTANDYQVKKVESNE